jgi:hypothetical protein
VEYYPTYSLRCESPDSELLNITAYPEQPSLNNARRLLATGRVFTCPPEAGGEELYRWQGRWKCEDAKSRFRVMTAGIMYMTEGMTVPKHGVELYLL